ncbi:hypothetical protein B0A55_02131 [Friedmanniomyces simplex]|uniref:Myb-like domain-containing protein n=1 Tax=Friedmanniomyces simplex TaxID=329884 RepID=A0A4U0XN93_9PEZI|nr:hypothetical protein B0A55_02131 [Friedmanniomyces simplex]
MEDTDYSSPEADDYSPQPDKPKRKSAAGRELIRWDPDKDQLVLLCVDYVCGAQGVAVPWDEIAANFGALLGKHNITGEAIKQHLSKLYKYRVEFNLVVPPKLDRTQRRKAVCKVENTKSTPAPTRARGKKGAADKVQDEEDEVSATPVKIPGSGLLHIKMPKPKKVKVQAAAPKTPGKGRGSGRKKRDDDDVTSAIEVEEEDEEGKKKSAVPRSSKRGRKSKSAALVDDAEDDMDMEVMTPTKKPKINLRALPAMDYREPSVEDETEAAPTFGEISGLVKQQSNPSQGSRIYNQSLPFGPASFGSATVGTSYQDYSQAATPAYTFHRSGDVTHFTPSPGSYGYNGLPQFRFPDQESPQMQTYNGYEYGSAAGVPPGYGGMVDFGHSFGTGAPGVKHISHAQISNALQAIADSHTNNAPAGGQGTRHDSFEHDEVNVNKVDKVTQPSSNDHLQLNTHFHGSGDFFNTSGLNTSSASLSPGETGITPAMAQTGFLPLAPVHNTSFDSGFGGVEDQANTKSEGEHGGQDVDFASHFDGSQLHFDFDDFNMPSVFD